MDNGTLIVNMLTVIGLLIPIATLIWKAAKQSGKIENLEERVKELEENYKNDIKDIKADINNINLSLAQLNAFFKFTQETIQDLKKESN